jgi:hypothetical protein
MQYVSGKYLNLTSVENDRVSACEELSSVDIS